MGTIYVLMLTQVKTSHTFRILALYKYFIYLLTISTYGCESWTLRKNEVTRLGLRKIPQVSWTANKTNKWVLYKAGEKKELLDTVKARKLAYYGHTMRNKKLSYRRGTARCVVLIEILPVATQQCRNYLYDKS